MLASDIALADADDEHPNLVVMSEDAYERLIDEGDERQASAAHAATRDDEALPHAMVKRLAAGENPIKLWRKHRGLTLAQLGEAVGQRKGYLSEIENGKKAGTLDTLRAIAAALRVDVDDIA
jgi:DNA-binding XRE family transcriptional regulator